MPNLRVCSSRYGTESADLGFEHKVNYIASAEEFSAVQGLCVQL